jgi:hypothetical protein
MRDDLGWLCGFRLGVDSLDEATLVPSNPMELNEATMIPGFVAD